MRRFRDTNYYVTTDGRVFNKNRVEKKAIKSLIESRLNRN